MTSKCFGLLAALHLLVAFPTTIYAAQGDDPEWPCIQRKVPALSFGQIWTGKSLVPESANWRSNHSLRALIPDLAARRLPMPEAEQSIEQFAKSLDEKDRTFVLSQLVNGLFEHMDQERSHIISGIARYAQGQNAMAQALRDESAAIETLRNTQTENYILIDQRQENLIFRMRIFQERAQSLTYVCEVPTLVEQRLYALVRAVSSHMPIN